MAHEIFVDTSGFYALLVKRDDRHSPAARVLKAAARERRGFLTTDYALDETATLLKARDLGHLLRDFFDIDFKSAAFALPGRALAAGIRLTAEWRCGSRLFW